MQYIIFKQLVKTPLFTPQDLRNLGISLHANELTRWLIKGYLSKLRNGLYAFSDQITELDPTRIATRLVTPSYISLEYALSHYGIIPEATYTITSITSGNTRSYNSSYGSFIYRHLPPRLFFGYKSIQSNNIPYYLADPEKALLDYLYLTANIKDKDSIIELRLNTEAIDWDTLHHYLREFSNKRVESLVAIIEDLYAQH